jgi:SAM-dependent methyltransferase
MKELIKKIPVIGDASRQLYWKLLSAARQPKPFPGSKHYWERNYADGGNSGEGSYGKFAEFKAEILNNFVATHHVKSVIEFGCGDGNQLALANYPRYSGFDVSATALAACRKRFASDRTKSFKFVQQYNGEKADLALSLDVIYHLVEDDIYKAYMRKLFAASNRYVIIYSSDKRFNLGYKGTHVWHRKFTPWVKRNAPEWKLIQRIPNRYPYHGDYTTGSWADFFIYEKGVS